MAGDRKITVRVNGATHEFTPPGPYSVGSAGDVHVPVPSGEGAMPHHAELRWVDGEWAFDSAPRAKTYDRGARSQRVRLPTPAEVHLGSEDGVAVQLRPAVPPRRRRVPISLIVIALIVVMAVFALGFVIGQREGDHRPFEVGTCLVAEEPGPAGVGNDLAEPREVPCDEGFDHKVIAVIPVPNPEAAAVRSDEALVARASEGCQVPGRAMVPRRGAGAPVSEVYCVRDAAQRIDETTIDSGVWCIEQDAEGDLLATPCSSRHDYEIVTWHDAPAADPDQEVVDGSTAGCDAQKALVPSRRSWVSGFREVLCLDQDNLGFEEVIDEAVKDLTAYWQEAPKVAPVAFTSERPASCGGEPLDARNAYYCGEEDTILWDEEWFRTDFYNRYGDIAVATVIAHEWGHLMQNRPGASSASLSGLEGVERSIFKERQADCYAGAWLAHLYTDRPDGIIPADTDRNKAIQAVVEVADAETSRLEDRESGAHGDAVERVRNFLRGFDSGKEACYAMSP